MVCRFILVDGNWYLINIVGDDIGDVMTLEDVVNRVDKLDNSNLVECVK